MTPFLPVHARIAAQAASTPHAEAVRGAEGGLSYSALEQRANALAQTLVAAGVGRERVVGLCMERSPELVVALLGVLKAGGAFLYLAPELGRPRLAAMCFAAGVRQVVVSPAGEATLATLDVQCFPVGAACQPTAPPEGACDPDALAYVIYTSGSTGQGKAVGIEQRALLGVTLALRRAYDIQADDRVLQFASPSWDTAIEEIFPTLLAGATLVLRTPDMIESSALLRGCAAQSVSVLNLPTSVWHRLVDALCRSQPSADLALPASLRTVIIGGEAAAAEQVRRWHEQVGSQVRLLNTYGLTEATAVCTVAELTTPTTPVPIGRPLPEVELSIRDATLRPLADEEVGELCVAGASLARGYLNAPTEQSQRFVPHPEHPGQRLYRTGDRGYRRRDGQFVCLGRWDQQVKVGGVRIELGEVEAVLLRHPGVREVAVLLRPHSDSAQLLACVVPAAPAAVSLSALRQLAAEHLPAAAVPALRLLDALPLLASGKVDRQRLAALWPAAQARALPSDAGEPALCALMAEVLDVAELAPSADFFAAGGNSLLATTLLLRARQELGLALSYSLVLEQRTPRRIYQVAGAVAGAAERHQSGSPVATDPEEAPTRSEAHTGVASIGQERHWQLQRANPHSVSYNLVWIIHLHGEVTRPRLEWVLTELVRRHEPLRTVLVEAPGEPLRAHVLPPDPVVVEVLESEDDSQRNIDLPALAAQAAHQPFDLGAERPFRVCWVRRSTCDSALIVTLHHVAVDGWSLSVLAREAAALDHAYGQGANPPLPALPIRYADYAAWQRRRVDAPQGQRQLAYWRQRLQGYPRSIALPYDRQGTSDLGGHLLRPWPEELSTALRDCAQRSQSTPFIVFLALFACALNRWSGASDLLIATPIANRSQLVLEPLVGLLLNALGLRIDLSGAPLFPAVLERARQTVVEAFANADIPVVQVIEAVRGPDTAKPFFQVMLVLQNTPPVRATFQGVRVEVEELAQVEVFYDLVLIVKETATGFGLEWEYNADRFSPLRLAALAEDFDAIARDALRGAPLRRFRDPA